jgi:hypothetical protein
MLPRTGNWIIVVGTVALFVGICVLLPRLSGNVDPDQLLAGAGLFSLGAMTIACGLYLKARAPHLPGETPAAAKESVANRRVRGGCELCGAADPVVLCKVHQIHLCGDCLNDHYDPRSCSYIPSTRRTNSKAGKAAARARGA